MKVKASCSGLHFYQVYTIMTHDQVYTVITHYQIYSVMIHCQIYTIMQHTALTSALSLTEKSVWVCVCGCADTLLLLACSVSAQWRKPVFKCP